MAVRSTGKRKKILLTAAILLILAVLFFAALKLSGWFDSKETPDLDVVQPGSSRESVVPDLIYKNHELTTKLSDKMKISLGKNSGLLSWYQINIRGQAETSDSSDIFLASDQLRYGMWLIEQRQEKIFNSWLTNFQSIFFRGGIMVESVNVTDGSEGNPDPSSLRDSLLFARLLITAYDIWPDEKLWHQINELSEDLLAYFPADGGLPLNFSAAIPTPAAVPDPAATPTPKPEISPTPEPMPIFQLTETASLDLLAIKLLTQVDPEWAGIYDKVLSRVKGSYISDLLPLYARAIWPDNRGYLLFPGDQPNIDAEASLTVLLHLCEVGEADERSIRWLSEQLFNNSAIFKTYHAAQGHAASDQECISAYAMAARIARITGDQPLYEKAVGRLAWHIATNPRSEALDLVFRQESEEQIRVYASDNVWALLAMD
jgi:hypothetical protein